MPENKKMKVGLIGGGLQGWRRASVFKENDNGELVIVACAHLDHARRLADSLGCKATDKWQDVVDRDDLDAILVCTPPHLHAEIGIAAMQSGKHILCEKPLGKSIENALEMVKVAKRHKVVLKCGFNHRHHPAIMKAKKAIDKGILGDLNFIRCRYGIVGRPGYEKEWRADPKFAGGGQLMEQGIHAIDLFRWFAGNFDEASGFVATRYWNIEPLEDNAFAIFRNQKGQMASLHSSLTQWKNLFSFEIFGQDGYVLIDGLGGGYGTETIAIGMRDFTKPFSEEITEYRGSDISWTEEWKEFVSAIQEKREPLGSGQDGVEAIRYVQAIYEASQSGFAVKLR